MVAANTFCPQQQAFPSPPCVTPPCRVTPHFSTPAAYNGYSPSSMTSGFESPSSSLHYNPAMHYSLPHYPCNGGYGPPPPPPSIPPPPPSCQTRGTSPFTTTSTVTTEQYTDVLLPPPREYREHSPLEGASVASPDTTPATSRVCHPLDTTATAYCRTSPIRNFAPLNLAYYGAPHHPHSYPHQQPHHVYPTSESLSHYPHPQPSSTSVIATSFTDFVPPSPDTSPPPPPTTTEPMTSDPAPSRIISSSPEANGRVDSCTGSSCESGSPSSGPSGGVPKKRIDKRRSLRGYYTHTYTHIHTHTHTHTHIYVARNPILALHSY